jgi:hypothetical protein
MLDLPGDATHHGQHLPLEAGVVSIGHKGQLDSVVGGLVLHKPKMDRVTGEAIGGIAHHGIDLALPDEFQHVAQLRTLVKFDTGVNLAQAGNDDPSPLCGICSTVLFLALERCVHLLRSRAHSGINHSAGRARAA